MKNVNIAGRIGKDAETRSTNSGNVTNFSVAVDDRSKKDAPALWFRCTLWGKRGDALAQYLTKGSNVTVCGDLSMREYEGKTYLEVNANDVTLQGGKPSNDGGNAGGGYQSHQSPLGNEGGSGGGFGGGMDDDIPFLPETRV